VAGLGRQNSLKNKNMFWRPSVKLSPLGKTNLGKYCQNSAPYLTLLMYFCCAQCPSPK